MIKHIFINLILILVMTVNLQAQMRKIPLRDFFKNPEKTGFQVSPDGKYISYLSPWEDRLNVFVQKLGDKEAIRVTSAKERDVAGYFWKGNDRIVFLQDSGGDENYKLYSVDRNGNNTKLFTPPDKVRAGIVDDLEDIDDEMLISLNQRDPKAFDVYRLNLATGEMTIVAENPGNIMSWITDHDGKLRTAVASDGVNNVLLYRDNESEQFREVLNTNFRNDVTPLFFTFDNKFIYALSNLNRDKSAVVKFDIANGQEIEVLYENPDVDVSGLSYSKKRKVLTSISYVKDKRELKFLDDKAENRYTTLKNKLGTYEVVITGMNKNEDKFLVRTYSDRSLGAYYFYDEAKGDFYKITDVSPWINEDEMCDMKPVQYTSRDGLTINGYLTLPRDVEAKNLPVVINPHGGPWHRDSWGYNPEIQFLANRGYAVLQMNFRGSTGYGKKFWEASFKQWGLKMQDDISDGVKWLINTGIADPKRVAIYGGSYGGYATLAGVTFTPDLYACAVDYVGVSNMFTFLKTIPPYWEPFRKMMYEMVGDPEKDSALFKQVSPVFHTDKIKAPLFVAQGKNDPRVNVNESDQMVEAMRNRGLEVEYMVKDNEGHGFRNQENRFDFYEAMEKFLEKHLKK
ncbi:MAG TPA: S9 family peptidase [Ignavibacteria bacterium]|nr:S9 family peptidase [Ignavibacteria bacterium]